MKSKRNTLFLLELKRTFSTIPSMLFGIVLFAAIILILSFVSYGVQKGMNKNYNKYHVAVVRYDDNKYTDFAIETIKDMDALKKTIVFEDCSKEKALDGLKKGTYDFAFVVPKNFVHDMMYGNKTKIEIHYGNYQNTVATYVIASLSDIATTYVEESEKSIFAMKDYMHAHNLSDISSADVSLTFQYISRLLLRNEIYLTKTLTPTDNIPLPIYYFCVGLILIFLLLGLQCARILSGHRKIFEQKLYAAGVKGGFQILSKYCSLLIVYSILYFIIIIGVAIFKPDLFFGTLKSYLILFPVCALLILIFELVENTANAILTLFVVVIGLGFFSGYLFPLSMLPESFYLLSGPTLTRIMLEYTKGCVCGGNVLSNILWMSVYTAVLILVAIAIKNYRIRH